MKNSQTFTSATHDIISSVEELSNVLTNARPTQQKDVIPFIHKIFDHVADILCIDAYRQLALKATDDREPSVQDQLFETCDLFNNDFNILMFWKGGWRKADLSTVTVSQVKNAVDILLTNSDRLDAIANKSETQKQAEQGAQEIKWLAETLTDIIPTSLIEEGVQVTLQQAQSNE